jgi:hypothetical protein
LFPRHISVSGLVWEGVVENLLQMRKIHCKLGASVTRANIVDLPPLPGTQSRIQSIGIVFGFLFIPPPFVLLYHVWIPCFLSSVKAAAKCRGFARVGTDESPCFMVAGTRPLADKTLYIYFF